jgi:ATP-dependent helicase/nuclease subunit A
VFGGRGFFRSQEIIDTYKLFNAALCKGEDALAELVFTDYYQAPRRNAQGFELPLFLQQLDAVLRQSTIDNALLFAFEKSGILDYYRSEQRYQAVANLSKLRSLVQEKLETEWLQPIGFLEYLAQQIRSKKDEDEAEIPMAEREGGFVTISTVHKAKGLTFPAVVVACCDKQIVWPDSRPKIIFDSAPEAPRLAFDHLAMGGRVRESDRDYSAMLQDELMASLAEELRILYVALTRGKHKVIALSDRHRREALADGNVCWARWIAAGLE